MINAQSSSREITRELILEMHDGILTDEDLRALETCTSQATYLWIGHINSRPVCAWGLVPPTLLADKAYLWLYAGPAIDEYKFQFVRHSMIVMEGMRELYPEIYGVTRADNPRAIRWLKWLGAKYGQPNEKGLVPFWIGGEVG